MAGFTLLEAIVALAIIGITLVPVLTFMGQASRQIAVAADSNGRADAQTAALAFIQTVNPQITPTGETALSEGLAVRWVSTPLVDPNSEAQLGGRLGSLRIGFYRVDVTVVRNNTDWFEFPVRKLGYQPSNPGLIPGTTP